MSWRRRVACGSDYSEQQRQAMEPPAACMPFRLLLHGAIARTFHLFMPQVCYSAETCTSGAGTSEFLRAYVRLIGLGLGLGPVSKAVRRDSLEAASQKRFRLYVCVRPPVPTLLRAPVHSLDRTKWIRSGGIHSSEELGKVLAGHLSDRLNCARH